MSKRKAQDKFPRYSLVEVLWIDAFGAAGWSDENDAPEPPVIQSVGYLMNRTEQGIILASGIPLRKGQMLAPSFIPHGMIKKIRRLK